MRTREAEGLTCTPLTAATREALPAAPLLDWILQMADKITSCLPCVNTDCCKGRCAFCGQTESPWHRGRQVTWASGDNGGRWGRPAQVPTEKRPWPQVCSAKDM